MLKEIKFCEVCGNDKLVSVLNLGLHPLCDDLVPIGSDRKCEEYPIEILFCETCKTAHNRFQVPKEVLFPHEYHYRARFTRDVTDGMEDLVKSCEKRLGDLKGKTILDIGCNDGCLLDRFKERGCITAGVEPTDAGKDAVAKGHVIYRGFFDKNFPFPVQPDIITFTNVFAHIDDLQGAIAALKNLIGPCTTVVIENHYLGSILDSGQFDTFYHEHPRTYSITSFMHIARSLGLNVEAVEFPKRYGGNVRVFLGQGSACETTPECITSDSFMRLDYALERWKLEKKAEIFGVIRKHGKLPAIAFPGRASILIRLLGLNENQISAVYQIDGSPKIGHYVPGTRIPIVSDKELPQSDTVLNLAWHISAEVKEHLASLGNHPNIIDICSPLSVRASESTATSQPSTCSV